jgi:hypothetical protein
VKAAIQILLGLDERNAFPISRESAQMVIFAMAMQIKDRQPE